MSRIDAARFDPIATKAPQHVADALLAALVEFEAARRALHAKPEPDTDAAYKLTVRMVRADSAAHALITEWST